MIQADAKQQAPLNFQFAHSEFRSCELRLEPGQLVLLVTGGVTESVPDGDDQFGVDRLIAYARAYGHRPARHIAHGICQAAIGFAGAAPQADDITSVVVKVEH